MPYVWKPYHEVPVEGTDANMIVKYLSIVCIPQISSTWQKTPASYANLVSRKEYHTDI